MVPTAASMLISEQSVLLTCVGMENDTVLSLVTVSVGFTMEGFFSWITTTRIEHETQKRCPLHYRGLECKSMKSRDTWSNRQIWPWNVEWSRTKNNRVLPRKCTGHSKHPLPTTKEKTLHMDITRWSTLKSDCLCSLQPKMEKLCTVNKNKTRSWLWLRSWTPYCQIQTQIEESRENH